VASLRWLEERKKLGVESTLDQRGGKGKLDWGKDWKKKKKKGTDSRKSALAATYDRLTRKPCS